MPRKTKFGCVPPVPQKVHFEAKNGDARWQEWFEAVMVRGAEGLTDPYEATRRLDAMGDEYLCPDCDKKLSHVAANEYRCESCTDAWFITLLPLLPEFPSWPLSNYWPELRSKIRKAKTQRQKRMI